MDRRQFLQRAMSSRSSSSPGTSSTTTTTKKDSSYSKVPALPLSDSNASPLRRKSISVSPYNTYHGSDGPNSPSHPTILRPPNSPLNRTLVPTAAAASSPPLANRKPVNNSPCRLYRQKSSEEIQSRSLWPASKKKNNIPAPDSGKETLGSFIDEDRRIEAEDRSMATYNSSTFSSRRRISFSDPFASTPETRGRRSLRYHIGKLRVENQLKKPGTPPSPSSSSSSSSGPPPSAPALPGRLSFNSAALTKKRSDSGLDIPSTESEKAAPTPRLSQELSRRLESPARRSRSPVKGRTSGVGSLISQGLSNLFRRKSFHHAESPKPLPKAAAAGAGSPVREVVKPAKAISSPGRDNVTAAAAGRSIGPIGSPSRAAAAVEWEAQHRLRMMHCYLTQWRFVNAAVLDVDQIKWANSRGTLVSSWLGLSDLQLLVARKRVQLLREKHGFKLNKLLYHQTQALDRWGTTEGQHMSAISSTKDSLQAAVCRVPLTDHAKADPHILSILLQQATNLAAAISENIAKCNSRVQSTAPAVAELAELAAKERPLIEESYELLGLLSSLEVREESLRCQLIQLKSRQIEQAAVVEKNLLAV